MPDYDFYRSRFGGTDLTAAEFARYAAAGSRVLAGFERRYRLSPCCEDARQLAVCQLAETLQYFDWMENGGPAAGVAVGSVSKKGASLPLPTRQTKSSELYRAAGLYFDIYRGPGRGSDRCAE